ncbi:hypothetical protein [Brenneria salicis]|uniref:Uncharacterized protein n=1 Tax=Brenneria salicis ATCC 15712 = DSM 30166 TaxID=714314 RepID=A0A366IBK0_9GAMM|nr:hypothetical protein [Brenneria salicis]RBP67620.1 hypothetical protein DES54_101140 [Brenneria salicis ATCC 15712 = DSM 30166]
MLNIITGVISGWLLLGWPPPFSLYSVLLLAKVMLVLLLVSYFATLSPYPA